MPPQISENMAKALASYIANRDVSVNEICKQNKVTNAGLTLARKRFDIECREKKKNGLSRNIDVEKINNYLKEIRSGKKEVVVPENFFVTKSSKKSQKKKDSTLEKKSFDDYTVDDVMKKMYG